MRSLLWFGVRRTIENRSPELVLSGKGEPPMWIAKGLFLGAGIFVAGTFAFLILSMRPVTTNHATGLGAIPGITIFNPLLYVALAACLALGALVGSGPVRVS
jgi:hypothetical protein